MTRRVVGLFVLAAVAGSIGTLIARDPGYVLLTWGEFSFETSVWFAAVLLLLALFALSGVLVFLELFFGSRRGVRNWARGRLERRARQQTTSGLLALARGDFPAARKALERGADHAPAPLLNHLAGARAAQAQGDLEARDALLRRALDAAPKATLAVGLTQAELQIAEGEWEPALATLLELRREAPRHGQVLGMLCRTRQQLGDWDGVLELVPDLRRSSGLDEDAVARIEREAWIARLGCAGEDSEDPLAVVRTVWETVPKALAGDAGLVAAAAERLDAVGDGDSAEGLLQAYLKKNWNPRLVEVYGRLEGGDPARREKAAKGWAKTHGEDPMLELARARIALRRERFEDARDHYARSLSLRETPEVCAELGRLETRLGDEARGAELLLRALELRAGPPLPLPEPVPKVLLERAS